MEHSNRRYRLIGPTTPHTRAASAPPESYRVQGLDGIILRSVWLGPDDTWEVEGNPQPHEEAAQPKSAENAKSEQLTFPSLDDAAEFAAMEGKFFYADLTAPRHVYQEGRCLYLGAERVQIRLSPSFRVRPGQWLGYLYYEHGQDVLAASSRNLEEAKIKTLEHALGYGHVAAIEPDPRHWREAQWLPTRNP